MSTLNVFQYLAKSHHTTECQIARKVYTHGRDGLMLNVRRAVFEQYSGLEQAKSYY